MELDTGFYIYSSAASCASAIWQHVIGVKDMLVSDETLVFSQAPFGRGTAPLSTPRMNGTARFSFHVCNTMVE
jgi:hypothetical protein